MKNLFSTGVLAVLLLAPAAAFAQKVNVDADPKAEFAKYKTYGWTDGTVSPNPLGEQRIHAAVEERMAAAGLIRAASNPDLVIATHILSKEEKELSTTGYGYGYGWYRMGGGMTTTSVYTYTQGTLVLDMFDGDTKQMVWRGVGTDTASDKADKNAKKVDKALDKMFKEYPPKAKKK